LKIKLKLTIQIKEIHYGSNIVLDSVILYQGIVTI
jgi:hypothetical protein